MNCQRIIFLAVIFFFHDNVWSQTDSASSNTSVMTLSNGSQAVQFFLLGQVTVAYKYHLSSQSALRFSAEIAGLFQDQKEDYQYQQSFQSRHQITNNQSVQMDAEYLYYFESSKRVRFFAGGGPSIAFERSKREIWYMESSNNVSTGYFEEIETFWEYGITATAGIECHVYEFLSLLAQYQIRASYAPVKAEGTNRGRFIKTWTVQLSSVQVGIAVYL